MQRKIVLVLALALLTSLSLATQAAAPCGIDVNYANAGPTPKGVSASVTPSVSFSGCAEIDDERSYSIQSVSGPSGGLATSVSSFSGRVTYTGSKVGVYTVTVRADIDCSCGSGADTTSFTVTIC